MCVITYVSFDECSRAQATWPKLVKPLRMKNKQTICITKVKKNSEQNYNDTVLEIENATRILIGFEVVGKNFVLRALKSFFRSVFSRRKLRTRLLRHREVSALFGTFQDFRLFKQKHWFSRTWFQKILIRISEKLKINRVVFWEALYAYFRDM